MDNMDLYDVNKAFADVRHEDKSGPNEYILRQEYLCAINNYCIHIEDLAKLVEIAKSKDINRLYGIKKRWDNLRTAEGNSKPRYRSDINTKALVNDYYSGMNANQLAKKYGCSYTLVVERLKACGCYKGRKK